MATSGSGAPKRFTRRAVLLGSLFLGGAAGGSTLHQSWLSQQDEDRAERAHIMDRHRPLPIIPVYDARATGLVGHARARLPQMLQLRQACIGSLTPIFRVGLRAADSLALSWLRRTRSPYVAELESIAALADEPGIFLLNTSYEWGCTALAAPSAARNSARLLRTLDWPYDGLGRLVEVVRQMGPAGEFLNVTWPGAVGVLTGMAPGRFAASINQAPARGKEEDKWTAAHNTLQTFEHSDAWPAMHLLRHVFEAAATFEQAKQILERTPLMAPTIFTLIGVSPRETCVIERTETEHASHTGVSSAANGWKYGHFPGDWAGLHDADARGDNEGRRRAIERYAARGSAPFAWVAEPILNSFTRLAIEADPHKGSLIVRGYEATPADDEPNEAGPATADLHLQWPLA
ncbi:hypothetical protein [Methylovirgula sp. 4M-Z18]|uniref:hypothetical protein n=1 Tax=Methylovirgula sp. 4M-Z18 TaxID=2293567 RepID=UPI0011C0740E|nr:hypothetical protein [Methylovirgula sp. 4M-Z18]